MNRFRSLLATLLTDQEAPTELTVDSKTRILAFKRHRLTASVQAIDSCIWDESTRSHILALEIGVENLSDFVTNSLEIMGLAPDGVSFLVGESLWESISEFRRRKKILGRELVTYRLKVKALEEFEQGDLQLLFRLSPDDEVLFSVHLHRV